MHRLYHRLADVDKILAKYYVMIWSRIGSRLSVNKALGMPTGPRWSLQADCGIMGVGGSRMIPISDELRSRKLPLITLAFVAINGIVFLYELLLGPDVDQMIMAWGAVPAYVSNPSDHPLSYLTLLTSMFLHGGWAHLIGNMLYLWIFGDNVEDRLGHIGYLAFYLAAGIVAGFAQVLAAPTSEIPGIGASGAVAGVLGVYLVLYPRVRVRVLIPVWYFASLRRVPALIVLGMWFGIQLLNGFLSIGSGDMATGGVAWFAHIGGFVVGLAVGFVLRILRKRPTVMPR